MGTCTSCCYVDQPQTATIIDPDGNKNQLKLPITAAELMLLNPGYFIASTDSLRRSLRYEAMPADHQVLPRKCYMLIPAAKLRCKLSQSDRANLDSVRNPRKQKNKKNNKNNKNKKSSSKVVPSTTATGESSGQRSLPSLGENANGHTGYKLVWIPVLEPISEAAI